MLFFGTKPIKLVLFDIGGVFVEAELDRYVQLGCAAFQTTPAPLRREIAQLLPVFETGAISSDEFWQKIGENLWKSGEGSLSIVSNCGEFWKNIFRATVRIDERMKRLVEALRQNGLAVGALSNIIADHAEILEKIGFYALFNPCVLSCREGMRKPQAEIFKLAAAKGGVSLKQCLFIDDQQSNTEAAQKLGMNALVFTSVEKLYQDLVQRRLLT
ncbi:MAG: HAD family hydrolase [Candidatus Bruticola sp.]